MQNDKIPPSKSDKTVGWIFTIIGILGILYAINVSYNLHTSRPDYTIGLMIGGILIRSLIPLLFISSGHYYLSGKNAVKKAKKGQQPGTTPQGQSIEAIVQPESSTNQVINPPATPSVPSETLVPQNPSVPQSIPPEQTPYTKP